MWHHLEYIKHNFHVHSGQVNKENVLKLDKHLCWYFLDVLCWTSTNLLDKLNAIVVSSATLRGNTCFYFSDQISWEFLNKKITIDGNIDLCVATSCWGQSWCMRFVHYFFGLRQIKYSDFSYKHSSWEWQIKIDIITSP